MVDLKWGLRDGIPESIDNAWGGRAILDRYGLDIPRDRQDWTQPAPVSDELCAKLNDALRQIRADIQKDPERYIYSVGQLVLYEDDDIVVIGDTHNSGGYLYMAAWLKSEEG